MCVFWVGGAVISGLCRDEEIKHLFIFLFIQIPQHFFSILLELLDFTTEKNKTTEHNDHDETK